MLVIKLTALAFLLALGLIAVTAIVFRRAGQARAFAIGLIAGNRNVGLMLAATGFAVPDIAWLYFALAQFPIYLLPHLLKPLAKTPVDRSLTKAVHLRGCGVARLPASCYAKRRLEAPMPRPLVIAPSILSADFAKLGDEIRAIEVPGPTGSMSTSWTATSYPNISIGPAVVQAIRPITKKTLDVHLMIAPVRSIPRGFRESRIGHHYSARRSRPARSSVAASDPQPWQEGRSHHKPCHACAEYRACDRSG